ncbi:lactaldehyde reductase [Listeria newyorkensis]|uniref:Lactaldehyde reductase n=1 Tax=Listeria newyorkensis TaxID=1497681 RepID=A0ABX4XR87_9LIST|nr:lactaldehyde reductase [Listeria newyorkensis]KGL38210.1 1,2-propanediol oxidoreductase [Listeria newyorkensis]PNP94325.1 lactaldehyde reductase [Listeria newyorkensis]WAO22740.1 lactaldehyde reductase [Listeria newyorkensis]SQC54184.1 Lactaldehyde reductase [Listeria newyorkensis]
MVNRMILNQTSYFGAGSIGKITDEVRKSAFQKAFIVTDKALVEHGIAQKVTALLDAEQLPYEVFDGSIPNPTIAVVKAGLAAFQQSGADYIIAIGGGSPIDTAKAIGIIATNPTFSDVRSLEGEADTTQASVPIFAVPTTSGTAAEVTINYVITDEERQRKFVCVDPHDIPLVAFVDSDMMMSMPKSLCAATGMDALTHAIEGYITNAAWELTDMLHLKAIKIIVGSLRSSVKGDAAGREKMALGQYIAGMGFSNVGLGLVHGMAHPLGAWYDTPHGVANAIILPTVMEYNAAYTSEKYRDIAEAMGVVGTESMSLDEARKAAVRAVAELSKDVGIPSSLSEVGVKEQDLEALAKDTLADVCTGGNPRTTNAEEILTLYKKLLY